MAKLNDEQRNFRVFGPDETLSNGLEALFEATNRQWDAATVPNDEFLAPTGRVMEMLSEHQCEGWLEGYLLTGRHGLFNCYEAFIHIVDSMFNQHAKWLKVTSHLPWRRKIASLNYLLASHVWRQDHNGFTHQDPGFIDHVVNKKAEVVRVYLPPDANCLLSVMDHCLRSRHYVNVVIAGKHPAPQWLTMDAAVKHCTEGIGIWQWASNDQGVAPDVVMACCGDVPTLETLAAVSIMREHLPDLKIRVVNVVDLMKLQPQTEHPHGLSDMDFDELFTKDKPVIFAFHAYPWLIHRLTYRRTNHDNIHVRGYKEEGTITTPFDMTVLNDLDRFHLVMDTIDRLPQTGDKGIYLKQQLKDKLIEHKQYIDKYGEDLPEIRNWKWLSPRGGGVDFLRWNPTAKKNKNTLLPQKGGESPSPSPDSRGGGAVGDERGFLPDEDFAGRLERRRGGQPLGGSRAECRGGEQASRLAVAVAHRDAQSAGHPAHRARDDFVRHGRCASRERDGLDGDPRRVAALCAGSPGGRGRGEAESDDQRHGGRGARRKEEEIPLKQLVPGDVVKLSAGDMIPADVRLIAANDLFITQGTLTGESLPVEKLDTRETRAGISPLELANICFLGTSVESGAATAVILATGAQTYFGSMAGSMVGEPEPTSFDKGMQQFTWLMIRFMMVMVPLVFLINGFTKHNWHEAFFFSIAVAVGLTPEMLPMIVSVCLSKGALAMSKKKVIVKQLNAIQNFGAMDVLCTDKTGTLTMDQVILERHCDVMQKENDERSARRVSHRAFSDRLEERARSRGARATATRTKNSSSAIAKWTRSRSISCAG